MLNAGRISIIKYKEADNTIFALHHFRFILINEANKNPQFLKKK